MSPPKKTVLEPLRVRVRRVQFTVGLGFLALVLGSVLSVSLVMRMSQRVDALPFQVLRFAVNLGLQKFWALAVLPVLCYGAARVIELRPWPTALGALAAGQGFLLALEFVQNGIDGWVERGWLVTAVEWGVLAGAAWLSQWAIVQGRAAATKQTQQTQQQAAARKDEYDEFLREAERQGEKIAQREAAKSATPAAPAVPVAPVAPMEQVAEPPPVPTSAPTTAPSSEGASEPKPADEQKVPSA